MGESMAAIKEEEEGGTEERLRGAMGHRSGRLGQGIEVTVDQRDRNE